MKKIIAIFLIFCMVLPMTALASDLTVISASSEQFSVKTPEKWKTSPTLKGPGGNVTYTNVKDEWAKWDLSGVSGEQDLYYYLVNYTDGKNDSAAEVTVFVGGKKFVFTVDHNQNPEGWYHLGTFNLDGSEGQ